MPSGICQWIPVSYDILQVLSIYEEVVQLSTFKASEEWSLLELLLWWVATSSSPCTSASLLNQNSCTWHLNNSPVPQYLVALNTSTAALDTH